MGKKIIFLFLILILGIFVFYFSKKTEITGVTDPLKIWEKNQDNIRVMNNSWDKIKVLRGRVENFKVHPGDTQKVWVEIESVNPIDKVVATVKTDNLERKFNLMKLKEELKNSKYLTLMYFQWKVSDVSYGKDYVTKFEIYDKNNESINWLLGWYDGPAGEFSSYCVLSVGGIIYRGDDIYKYVYSNSSSLTLTTSNPDTFSCSLRTVWGIYSPSSMAIKIDNRVTFQIESGATLVVSPGNNLDVSGSNITVNIVSGGQIVLKTTPVLIDSDSDGYWDRIATSGGSAPSSDSNGKLDCDPNNNQKSTLWAVATDVDHDGYAVSNSQQTACLSGNITTAQDQAFLMDKVLVSSAVDIVKTASTRVSGASTYGMISDKNYALDNLFRILKTILSKIRGLVIKEVYARPPCFEGNFDCVYERPILPTYPPTPVSWTVSGDLASVTGNSNGSGWLFLRFNNPSIPNFARISKISFNVSKNMGPISVEVALGYDTGTGILMSINKYSFTTNSGSSFTVDFYNSSNSSGFYITGSDVRNGKIGLLLRVTGNQSMNVYFNSTYMNVDYLVPRYKGDNDCYDYNPDAFPGQTASFPVNRGDGSFDYNCDGTSTQIDTTICSSGRVQKDKRFFYSFIDRIKRFIISSVLGREQPGGTSYCCAWVESIPSCGSSGQRAYYSQNYSCYNTLRWTETQQCR